ncbi:pentapeptide repeat-containing protein [Actinomyces trachealis]|uniref:pentapeptide repeat-containing protein n=1 Tax=Actinomyces trachealis TaxID=2763540 RepID=UPI0018C57838|nr:pentapeptide repeat-containing protein [Actinomyces trachealis]
MTQQEQTAPVESTTKTVQLQKVGEWSRQAAKATRTAWSKAAHQVGEEISPAWKQRPRLSSLGRSVVVWLGIAALVFTALGWFWGEPKRGFLSRLSSFWSGASFNDAAPGLRVIAALLTILTMCAVALVVITFRERAAAERRESEVRLTTLVEQLGSASPQVRIAAVYGLAEVADTQGGAMRQHVVDLLCGYLRTERGSWHDVPATAGSRRARTARRFISEDAAVESTVLHVLAQHLRQGRDEASEGLEVAQELEDSRLWCDCRFDLHGAVLSIAVPFRGLTFMAPVDLSGVVFNTEADFSATHFAEKADFQRAVFKSAAVFRGASFGRLADFSSATFAHEAVFSAATFNWFANFKNATFLDAVAFQQSFLRNSDGFTGAVFNRAVKDKCRVRFALRDSNQFQDPTGLPFGSRWVRFERSGSPVAVPPVGGSLDYDSTADADS